MKTSRHLTETPGVHERTSEIGDDKPETLARGALAKLQLLQSGQQRTQKVLFITLVEAR